MFRKKKNVLKLWNFGTSQIGINRNLSRFRLQDSDPTLIISRNETSCFEYRFESTNRTKKLACLEGGRKLVKFEGSDETGWIKRQRREWRGGQGEHRRVMGFVVRLAGLWPHTSRCAETRQSLPRPQQPSFQPWMRMDAIALAIIIPFLNVIPPVLFPSFDLLRLEHPNFPRNEKNRKKPFDSCGLPTTLCQPVNEHGNSFFLRTRIVKSYINHTEIVFLP